MANKDLYLLGKLISKVRNSYIFNKILYMYFQL